MRPRTVLSPCVRCGRTHDEFGRLTLDPFGNCTPCVEEMRAEFEKGLLEDARTRGEWPEQYPEPPDLRETYRVGDA